MRRGRRADQSVFYQLCCCSRRKNRRPSLGSGRPRRAPQMQKAPPSQSGGTPWNGWQCLALLFSLLHRRPEKSPKLSRPGRRDFLHPAVSGQRLSLSGKRKYFSFSSFHSTAGSFLPLPGFISSTALEEFSCFRYCSFFSAFFAHES